MPSPALVQYLYSICTVYVRFVSVHILYIYCTNTVHMLGMILDKKGITERPRTRLLHALHWNLCQILYIYQCCNTFGIVMRLNSFFVLRFQK